MKRIISIILVVVVCFCFMPFLGGTDYSADAASMPTKLSGPSKVELEYAGSSWSWSRINVKVDHSQEILNLIREDCEAMGIWYKDVFCQVDWKVGSSDSWKYSSSWDQLTKKVEGSCWEFVDNAFNLDMGKDEYGILEFGDVNDYGWSEPEIGYKSVLPSGSYNIKNVNHFDFAEINYYDNPIQVRVRYAVRYEGDSTDGPRYVYSDWYTTDPYQGTGYDELNGRWNDKTAVLKNTAEAELMVRYGDIDACSDPIAQVNGYDPFNVSVQYSHAYPWLKDDTDPTGTDRISCGTKTKAKGNSADGYSSNWWQFINGKDKENAYTSDNIKLNMEYTNAISGITVESAMLQLCVDDFHRDLGADYSCTINGKDAPFISEVMKQIDQSGAVTHFITTIIPKSFLKEVQSGKLNIVIEDENGAGDGYAIDFVKLLVNYNEKAMLSGTITGKTNVPEATVRLLGTSQVVLADKNGNYTLSAAPGLNAVRISKYNYVEDYTFGVVVKGQTSRFETVCLQEGKGSTDVDYSSYGSASMSNDAITLSGNIFTYNGKAKKPTAEVKNEDGELLVAGTDYKMTYMNNTKVGMATAIITGIGDYEGVKIEKTFKINPPKVAISSLSGGSKKLTVKWKKTAYASQTEGYQVRYSLKSTMANSKTVTIKSNSTLTKTIKSLKSGKTYYVQVRTYKYVNGVKYNSGWSTKKSVKVK